MNSELLNGTIASVKYADYLRETAADRHEEIGVKADNRKRLYFLQLALQRIGLL